MNPITISNTNPTSPTSSEVISSSNMQNQSSEIWVTASADDDPSIREIENGLCRETHLNLTFLSLHSIQLVEKDVKAITAYPNLTFLNLRSMQLVEKDVKTIAAHPNITFLDLSTNLLDDECTKAIATMSKLRTLIIADNYITAKGAAALAVHPSLTELNVSMNQIGNPGAIALAANLTLVSLNISSNSFEWAGAITLIASRTWTFLKVVSDFTIWAAEVIESPNPLGNTPADHSRLLEATNEAEKRNRKIHHAWASVATMLSLLHGERNSAIRYSVLDVISKVISYISQNYDEEHFDRNRMESLLATRFFQNRLKEKSQHCLIEEVQ